MWEYVSRCFGKLKLTPESHPNPYETIGHSVYAHEKTSGYFEIIEIERRGNRKGK
jgi:hypothetical protein